MVAKHRDKRVKRVKRVKRTIKKSKHVRRGRKTYTRHNRRTGGTLYNPYTKTHDPESTLERTQFLLKSIEEDLSNLNENDPFYVKDLNFYTTEIGKLKEEIENLKN